MRLAKGLWKYVDGSEVLAEDVAERAQTEFKKLQRHSPPLSWAISTPLLYLVTLCKQPPKDVWDTLRKHFERETLANKLLLKKQYFQMEMKEGTSIDEHLKQMKDEPASII